ncbi:MAG: NADPH-dependent F420 reductase [Flavobacteriaceae bacterium]
MKKIGILGSGIVGQTLGSGFIKHGYEVMIGTRNVSKLIEWTTAEGQYAHTGSFKEATAFGNSIVLAVKGIAAEAVLGLAGAQNLAGKTVMDATNPIDDAPPEDGVLHFFTKQNESLMEILQTAYPDTHFVKAFNSVSHLRMVNPDFESRPTMFICGNNEKAKKEVAGILDQFGWDTEDFGLATSARGIEALCMLYCTIGFRDNRWTQAFKLLT